MKKTMLLMAATLITAFGHAQGLKLNDLEYFERQGVNVLVFSNPFTGGFNDTTECVQRKEVLCD